MMRDKRPIAVVTALYWAVATGFFLYLLRYYITGAGGPTTLAVLLVPVTYVLFVLNALREGGLYPRLGAAANMTIGAIYIALSVAVSVYMTVEFFEIRTVRAGFWNTPDLVMGSIMTLLVLEYSRLRYPALFFINIGLILYAVYGWVVPGMFGHLGLSWTRIASAMSVETTTGVFSDLPQLALTLIGSFLLVLSVMRAFGCVDSILKAASRVAARSPHALPQSAVLGSMGVAAVTGSGAANAASTGSVTIPAMIGAGMPRPHAAAIEAAASLGGQLMPPVMGISAFLMAEFLGVSYFEVVARGYAPALIYFLGVGVGTYILSIRHRTGGKVFRTEPVVWIDWINVGVFVAVVAGLIGLMGVQREAPMIAALQLFTVLIVFLAAVYLARLVATGGLGLRALVAPAARMVDAFASMVAELTLLLAVLSIMTGAFVITGVPTKIGSLLIEMAGVSLVAMVIVAFVFGALLGTGLPPAPTYILTALVLAPAMIRIGVNPWVVHFFAFFLAVWGELTPPTSVVAAVTARIAETSFGATLWSAIKICCSLFILMGGVFARPELVIEPGLAQLWALLLLSVATAGLTFALQARFAVNPLTDAAMRVALGLAAWTVTLHPDDAVATAMTLPVLAFIAYWILRCRNTAWVQAPEPA